MNKKNLLRAALLALVASNAALAEPPNISNLTLPQTDALVRTFGADLAFRPVEPPSAYADYFGATLGVIGVLTKANEIASMIPQNSSMEYLPGGDLFLGVQGPAGVAIETGFLPEKKIKGVTFKKAGGALKWTVNKAFTDKSPVEVAVRTTYTTSRIEYQNNVGGVPLDIDFTSKIIGANTSIGVPLAGVVEPYIGAGWLKQTSNLSGSGNVRLFNTSYTASGSVGSRNESAWYFAGLQMRLAFFTVSFEWDKMFGIDTYSTKLAFKF